MGWKTGCIVSPLTIKSMVVLSSLICGYEEAIILAEIESCLAKNSIRLIGGK